MTSYDVSPAPRGATRAAVTSTQSFGRHRATDVPVSALGAGASLEPVAFRRKRLAQDGHIRRGPHEPPVLTDLLFQPFAWIFGPGLPARRGALAMLITVVTLVILL